MNDSQPQYQPVPPYDRIMGSLVERPDVQDTQPSTLHDTVPMIGRTLTTIVRTFRENEKGDWISVEQIVDGQAIRIWLPPKVTERIARQRDSLTTKNRKKGARQGVETRKRKGIVPAFLKGKKNRGE